MMTAASLWWDHGPPCPATNPWRHCRRQGRRRLTRSLFDFAKIVEAFDAKGVSFVSITQQFNTTTSMGRLTLNVLFAQFEREVAGERIRDKIAASKKKGMWMGGLPWLGYDVKNRKLVVKGSHRPPHLPAVRST